MPSPDAILASTTTSTGGATAGLTRAVLSSHERQAEQVVFTLQTPHSTDLRKIVRSFRSSCSSVGGSSVDTGTCTASTSSHLTATSSLAAQQHHATTVSLSSGSSKKSQEPRYPVRVSFVPLDPDFPLEEQHGGKMDIILHKLTEDILSLSQLALTQPAIADLRDLECLETCPVETAAAVRRVHRLVEFQRTHQCCLVDDPVKVQTLMSRADIAVQLASCLQTVHTASNMPVESPKYAALHTVEAALEQVSHLKFPLIVKPLTAAGTKASHAMAVVLDPSAFTAEFLKPRLPCLCQEYANHNAALYKVYVLGDKVSVHKRRSLPNLPATGSRYGFLEFDSQRPYPRLTDFGYDVRDTVVAAAAAAGQASVKRRRRSDPGAPAAVASAAATTTATGAAAAPLKTPVTAEEVMPVVQALKQAFGLDLFGFDVLLTDQEMLVVDVNYFPSYKEVPNFPALLAKYLTDRAVQSRRRQQSTSTMDST